MSENTLFSDIFRHFWQIFGRLPNENVKMCQNVSKLMTFEVNKTDYFISTVGMAQTRTGS